MTPALPYLGDLRPAFLAHLADRLNEDICAQTAIIAAEDGISAPIRTHSALLFLYKCGPASVSDIAQSDGQSHQLVTQRLAPLEKLNLIERFDDPEDGRRRPFRLTPAGEREARRVETLMKKLAAAFEQLFRDIGVDLIDLLDSARDQIRRVPLNERSASIDVETRKEVS